MSKQSKEIPKHPFPGSMEYLGPFDRWHFYRNSDGYIEAYQSYFDRKTGDRRDMRRTLTLAKTPSEALLQLRRRRKPKIAEVPPPYFLRRRTKQVFK